jgi:hypothetical protein
MAENWTEEAVYINIYLFLLDRINPKTLIAVQRTKLPAYYGSWKFTTLSNRGNETSGQRSTYQQRHYEVEERSIGRKEWCVIFLKSIFISFTSRNIIVHFCFVLLLLKCSWHFVVVVVVSEYNWKPETIKGMKLVPPSKIALTMFVRWYWRNLTGSEASKISGHQNN